MNLKFLPQTNPQAKGAVEASRVGVPHPLRHASLCCCAAPRLSVAVILLIYSHCWNKLNPFINCCFSLLNVNVQTCGHHQDTGCPKVLFLNSPKLICLKVELRPGGAAKTAVWVKRLRLTNSARVPIGVVVINKLITVPITITIIGDRLLLPRS